MTLKSLEASIRVYGKLKEVWNYPKKVVSHTEWQTRPKLIFVTFSANEEQKKCLVVQYRF